VHSFLYLAVSAPSSILLILDRLTVTIHTLNSSHYELETFVTGQDQQGTNTSVEREGISMLALFFHSAYFLQIDDTLP